MVSPFQTAEDDDQFVIDPAQPLKGVVVCCTSIPPEHRANLDKRVSELGGLHKYDLTPDVTHLVVGDYNTAKYRHVARERPDIKAMDVAWIDKLNEFWKNDDELDYFELERQYTLKPLESRGADPLAWGKDRLARDSLLICLTGFGDQREAIAEIITTNGGRYTGDLTKKCTHLIAKTPEGKKFNAAKAWNIFTVTLGWLEQSVARGMILEESKFDPLLPVEEQGRGAWVKKEVQRRPLGKRSRSAMLNGGEVGPRKLRKTASMKLSSQRNNIWGDILGHSASREYSFANEDQPEAAPKEPEHQTAPLAPQNEGVFSNCFFYIHGFNEQRTSVLHQTITTIGGIVCATIGELATAPAPKESASRFIIVPQTSQPDTHPKVEHSNIIFITEYYIEKSLHHKVLFDPCEHVLGRPFSLFPIPGFSDLIICKAAFTGIELNQVARSVTQLGAKFEEDFHKETSVLVCKSLSNMRKEKLRLAIKWGVPVVPADWLWECIATGFKAPIQDFIYPELKKHYEVKVDKAPPPAAVAAPSSKPIQRTHSEPVPKPLPRPPIQANVDTTAFERDPPNRSDQRESSTRGESHTSREFVTARTHPADSIAREFDTPIIETSSTRLNKSPSPKQRTLSRSKSELSHRPATPQPGVAQGPDQQLQEAIEKPHEDQQDTTNQASNSAQRQALSSKLTSLIQATEPQPQANQQPRPRRRQIFGRALSNASNASSNSAALDKPATTNYAESFLGAADIDHDGSDNQRGHDDSGLTSATQLEYRDPEAQEHKAVLMDRMMGGKGEVKRSSTVTGAEGVQVVGGRSLRRR